MPVEKVIAVLILASFILLFIILGIILIKGKGSSLIAGYNTMSEEEKKKYESVALGKHIGNMMFALAFCMLFWIAGIVYELSGLIILGIVLFIGIVIITIITINTGNRVKK